MTRETMITLLVQDDLEFYLTADEGDVIEPLTSMLMNGCAGFSNMSDEQLIHELEYRGYTTSG